MKKLLLACAVTAICFGLCSNVSANPTLTVTEPFEIESIDTVTDNDDSDDGNLFEDLISWIKDLLGLNDDDDRKDYYSSVGNSGIDSGDDGLDIDSGDGNGDFGSGDDDWGFGSGDDYWGSDSGDDDWGSDSGNDDWGSGSGNDGWGSGDADASPGQPIPAPGALLLGGIGSGIIGWLRRRRTL